MIEMDMDNITPDPSSCSGKGVKAPCKRCMGRLNKTDMIQGHLMSLNEIFDKGVLASDILYMTQYPISGLPPTLKDSDFDLGQRMVYFIPGRETKYVKISE